MEIIDWLIEGDPNKFSAKELIVRKIAFQSFFNFSTLSPATLDNLNKIRLVHHYKQLSRLNTKSLLILLKVLP